LEYDAQDEILITVGVSEGFDLALRAIINPKDKILIPSPGYVSYGPLTELAGGIPVYINTEREGFKLTPKVLERHIDNQTKAIILNYPNNPTGVSYTKRELVQINKVLLKHKILCVSDEIYSDLTYDFEHVPFATLAQAKNNTVYLNGFSKSYAMTGWRVGFACGPKEIIAAMTKIHQYTIMCVAITSQMAASEALETGRKSVEEMRREYKRRREFLLERLNSLGLECVNPNGAFYLFASLKKVGLKSLDFAERLLKKQKVAVVPGVAFGLEFDNYVRISYASSFENLKEAMARLERFLKGGSK
jgi:aminotransferase